LHGKTANIAIHKTGYETFTATTILKYLPDAILDIFMKNPEQENSENNDKEEKNN